MNVFKRIFATFLAFASLFISSVTKPNEKDGNFRVTSYVVADSIQSVERIYGEDFDIITDVILFGGASFNAKGKIEKRKTVLETALSNLRTVIGERNVKIFVNLLGPGALESHDDYVSEMNDQAKQHTLAFKSGVLEDNIVALLDEYDFDGVFFDYEYPLNTVNWGPFNRFLVRLDKKLGKKILGLAVVDWDIKLSLGSFMAVDRFEAMLYDGFDEEGRHATPETVRQLLKKMKIYSIPKEKLDVGLAFYARPTDRSAYWYDYASCCDRLDENGFYYDASVDKTFWFNRPSNIAETAAYALDEGYGGVMIWHYTCDFPSSDPRSLLNAVGNTVKK